MNTPQHCSIYNRAKQYSREQAVFCPSKHLLHSSTQLYKPIYLHCYEYIYSSMNKKPCTYTCMLSYKIPVGSQEKAKPANIYCKQGKIHWAKFSQLLRVPQGFPMNTQLQLNNKYCWPRHHESILVNNYIGMKPRMFSPVNPSIGVFTLMYFNAHWTKSHQTGLN